MSKLTTLKPRLSKLAPRLSTARAIRDTRYSPDATVRGWYKSARWQDLRDTVLVRDLYTCRQTGVLLYGDYPAPNSPVVDHVVPHRGDERLFWDIGNLQAVSKFYHDGEKRRIELRGEGAPVAAFFPKWLKPSVIPLTIVCGPAASGKSTYVQQRAKPSDLIIDLDVIASRLSGQSLHEWDRDKWLNAAVLERNGMLGDLAKPSIYRAAWFIVSEPKPEHRQFWDEHLKPQQIVVLARSEETCIAQAAMDSDRDQQRAQATIRSWWSTYRPRRGDVVL